MIQFFVGTIQIPCSSLSRYLPFLSQLSPDVLEVSGCWDSIDSILLDLLLLPRAGILIVNVYRKIPVMYSIHR